MITATTPSGTRAFRGLPLAAIVILVMTAALALTWSHYRLLDQDEFLSFYTDSTPTVRDVLHVQLHTPISLDPPTYHLLSHLAMDVFGRNATSLRLPALCGFLLMQLALFLLVRKLAGERVGLIAMAFPFATASFRYAVEGRPYGLLLGLNALAFLCWYVAAKRDAESLRTWPMFGLAVAIVAAMTSHYFGILVLVPLVCGEIARTMTNRRIDKALAANITLSGIAGVLAILPFKAALAPYQQHYYIATVNPRVISQGYRELFVRYNDWRMSTQHVAVMLLLIGFLVLVVAAVRRFQRRADSEPGWLWFALLGFAALPFFGFVMGRFATHTLEVRYVVATIVPFAVVVALVLAERSLASCVLIALLICGTITGILQIRAAHAERDRVLSAMTLPNAVQEQLASDPQERIYTQSLNQFFAATYYAPDALRSRVSLIFDEDREVALTGHNTNAVTAENLVQFTSLSTTRYAELRCVRHGLLLDTHSSWEWIDKALEKDFYFSLIPDSRGLGGDLYRIVPQPLRSGESLEYRCARP